MAFFRKLFRSRNDQTPEETPAVSAESVPAVPDTSAPDVAAPADEEASQPVAEPAAPPDEVPWWEASAPPDEAARALGGAEADTAAPPPSDERPAAEGGEAATSRSAALDQSLVATQPVTTISTGRSERDSTRELGEGDSPSIALRPSEQGLAAAAMRDIGRVRQINQDSVFAMVSTLPREGGDVPMGLFVVADGMGGHEGGEVASRLAVSSVVRHVLSQIVLPALEDGPSEALQPVMIDAIKEANRTIWDQAQGMGSDMGTTCTAVLMLGSALYISHVGDSRAYVLEPEGLRLLTNDHSAVGRLIQLGQLAPSEAREHPLRSQLYRTVGQHPQVQVDFIYHHLGEGSHLLMGSDGLWSLLDEQRMEQALRSYLWPQDACRELISLANLAGGDDNISAVVVSFHVAERATA